MTNRFLAVVLLTVAVTAQGGEAPPAAAAAERAHAALWARFVDGNGLIRDFVGELPTPEDCELGRPNAIGWWSPIENGPMFTGLYLPAACERARRSGKPEDREKARRLARGLLLCASVSDVPGFIARGVGTDGRCHYPMGSDDQTHPWFYGLHAYVTSGVPDAEEKSRVTGKMREIAGALEANGWRCPCDGAFKGQFRGGYTGHLFRDAARYLYLLRAMHEVTGEAAWLVRYRAALAESPKGGGGRTRAEICALGYRADREAIPHLEESQMWIYVGCQGSLARLIAMERDETVCRHYRTGLAQNAADARAQLAGYRAFDSRDTQVFGHAEWRAGYPEWFPQKTQADAERLARTGDQKKLGTRKAYERRTMRNPLAAAAIVARAGDEGDRGEIGRAVAHYDYGRLNMAEFFFAECAFFGTTNDHE
jgi:hypothetical protein